MTSIKSLFTISRVSLTNAMSYRARILTRFCYYTLFIYVFMCLWKAIYSEGDIGGFTHTQIVWYLIMTELVAFGCSSGVRATINDDVKSGSIAYMIGRPTNYISYQFFMALGETALNMAAFGAFAVVLGLVFVGPLPGFSLWTLPFILLSLILSVIINFFFFMAIGLTAFIMEDNMALYLIYQKLCFMLGTFLPVEFLPEWLQGIAKSLPFSYASWAPARLFADFSMPMFIEIFPRQVMWAAFALGLSALLYRTFSKKLQINGG